MSPVFDIPLPSPSKATAVSPPAISARSRVRRRQTLDRRKDAVDPDLRRRDRQPIDIDFRGTVDDVLARLPAADASAAAEDAVPPRPARSRPSETRRGRARGHLAAAALGMAGAAVRRRFGCDAQAGRGGAARQQGQGPDQAGAGSGLSFHVGDGRQQAALRGSDPRAVRGRRRAVSRSDRGLARRRARPRRRLAEAAFEQPATPARVAG